MTWSNADRSLRDMFPGMRSERRRRLIGLRLRATATALAEAYAAGSAQYKEAVHGTEEICNAVAECILHMDTA